VIELLTPRTAQEVACLARRQVEPPAARRRTAAPQARDYRKPAEQDRDRVLYSAAFQRLAYVTQVTAPESGYALHNRLTHSLKVAQVGRRNAQRLIELTRNKHLTGVAAELALSLDPDAVEASCLAHDLGHPPFGHIAEEILNDLAREHVGIDGGFEGNAQSFRLVTRLCQRASGSGLNLTRQVLGGLLKYPWHWHREDKLSKRERKWGYYLEDKEAFEFARVDYPAEDDDKLPELSLEALIMEWADDLTYAVHDVDDFYRAGLIPLHRLANENDDELKRLRDLMQEAKAAAPKAWPRWDIDELVETVQSVAAGAGPTGAYLPTMSLRRDMRRFNSELITRYLSAFTLKNDNRKKKVKVCIDEALEREVGALKMLAHIYVIRSPGLAVVQHGQKRVVEDLFKFYFKASQSSPEKGGDRRVFPPGARQILAAGSDEAAPRARVVTDLISGLTESAALELHRRMIGGYTAPTLDGIATMA
jgi:dGTPase